MTVEVVEYTDPWCSWAWGSEPKLRRLRWQFADRFEWRTVMGDLVADRRHAQPDFDPARAAPKTAVYWQKVHEHTGQPWPVHLKWAPTLSAHAGLAVKAAQQQNDAVAAALLRSVRESCFVYSAPADSVERIFELADTLDGLDVDRLELDFRSDAVVKAFAADRDETRRPNDYVLTLQETHEGKGNAKPEGDGWRYVFPTLLFRGEGGEHTVPGWQPWDAYVAAMEAAVPGSTADPRPDPTPDEALARWPLLTAQELSFLCGDDAPAPSRAIEVDWGAGVVFRRP
ncbi:MAG TPA: DsbA family protein [Acidimicrobiales bacterium]|jgi:predicted DsbA family dithiol-disulfide isomerase|nr:DsbA family protein [Acidimicrobiales bacterium]